MQIRELIDKLAEYPATMEVVIYDTVESWSNDIKEVTEDTEIPNTVIIKI